LHYIQNQPDLAQLPVVIVSAKSLPEDIAEGLKAGAIAYLTKPVSYAEMRKIIEEAVTSSSKTQGVN
jgi:CheY-like chemotaxis protein